jgi:hypothetical protein
MVERRMRCRRIVGTFAAAATAAVSLALAAPAVGDVPAGSPAPVAFASADDAFSGTTGICGFPVDFTVRISWKARSFPPDQGHAYTNVVNWKVDWTVSGNGKTVEYHEAYTETFFPSNDFPDLLVVRAQHGLTFGIRLDGSGLVSRDAGTLVFLPDGTIAALRGQHPTELAGGLGAAFAEICTALAGA